MIDYVIMMVILIFLVFEILYNSKFVSVNEHFFDRTNTNSMRGFWCLVVILVHVPTLYQNRIQDMIGSFAYIGVTFFFMTSSYGLTLSQANNPNGIHYFWRKRLPKLLFTSWIISILFSIIDYYFNGTIQLKKVFGINEWVKWLLACYLLFWISNMVFRNQIYSKIGICIMITVGSLLVYFMQRGGFFTRATWTTECYGFVWGILLASFGKEFISFFKEKWLFKWCVLGTIATILGCLYLKYKIIPFAGDYLLKIILGIAITCFILCANTRIELGNSVNMFLGKISFEIYLIHGDVFRLMGKIREWNHSGLYILCCIFLTVFLASAVHIVSDSAVKVLNKMPIMQNDG
ncbi:acyltransferase family protein [Butyrivibrio sp. YAB3001]|uniref:acyltransferase family protein n=1 Tax=Butyrivibrio sp. YAB3001 TaxID=1520812 RepID=UPI0008F662D0|nr:acyltransferase family protein [Butyrivibrio sp. YAB3001]SFC61976.1 Peptidoglycan/LPS O-acetylase OafA/YrhL, contains acyltransferase and SGNH-hydrolase domains [Butyrivibrio sp. YAB3001]